jgi:hypothetical protein
VLRRGWNTGFKKCGGVNVVIAVVTDRDLPQETNLQKTSYSLPMSLCVTHSTLSARDLFLNGKIRDEKQTALASFFALTQCVISVSLIAKGGMDYAYKKSKSKCHS